jgi:uracil-DNA glycosylase
MAIKSADIKAMFAGITQETKTLLSKTLQKELLKSIKLVNADMSTRSNAILSPSADLIFNAFRHTPIETTRVVVIGQDPYINPGEAQGMSFSTANGSIPPSLRNIYNCLQLQGLIPTMPTHGDLSQWAKQGVLLLNAALTTIIGTSNVHAKCWQDFTDELLKQISQQTTGIVFVLLGGFAQAKASLINHRKHHILTWGHPSTQNFANRGDNPKHFKYCTVFSRTNDILISRGQQPINWCPDGKRIEGEICKNIAVVVENNENTDLTDLTDSPDTVSDSPYVDAYPPPMANKLWIFTDGGALANGKPHCKASWGWFITDDGKFAQASGLVELVDIPNKCYKTSNQRGELTAISKALEFVHQHHHNFDFDEIIIISDSEYSINCLTDWVIKWNEQGIEDKRNLDLITPAWKQLCEIKRQYSVTMRHIRSHKDEPDEADKKFYWKGNDIADKLCDAVLGVTKK